MQPLRILIPVAAMSTDTLPLLGTAHVRTASVPYAPCSGCHQPGRAKETGYCGQALAAPCASIPPAWNNTPCSAAGLTSSSACRLTRALEFAKNTLEKRELFGDAAEKKAAGMDIGSMEAKQIIAEADKVQQDDLKAVRRMQQMVEDTEEVGVETNIKLKMQTEQLKNIQIDVYSVNVRLPAPWILTLFMFCALHYLSPHPSRLAMLCSPRPLEALRTLSCACLASLSSWLLGWLLLCSGRTC